jgi:hypothetical protein
VVRKKTLLTTFGLLTLAALCIYSNRDWFSRDRIQISSRNPPSGPPGGRRARPGTQPVLFNLNGKYRLTSVAVVAVSELQTNKNPHSFWELVAWSNSVPTREFAYGAGIGGMHPKLAGARPEALQPGAKYRLIVKAGSLRTEHDFETPPAAPASQ